MYFASEAFGRRFLNFLGSRGLTTVNPDNSDNSMEIYRDNEYICTYSYNGKADSDKESEDLNAINEFLGKHFKCYIFCDYGDKLLPESAKGYTKFFEVENIVLGAKILENDTIEYITWQYTDNRKDVADAHYYFDDYAAAKEDFAIRAGLIEKDKIFQRADMKAVYAACVYLLISRDSLTAKQKERLTNILDRIEATDKSIPYEYKMNMIGEIQDGLKGDKNMSFFEKEMRKLFEDKPLFKNAVFNDKTVLVPLSDGRCFKLSFEAPLIVNCFDTLRLRVINTNQGEIDRQDFQFWDILDRVCKSDINPDGKTAHIWVYDGKVEWYGVSDISNEERKRLSDKVCDYLSIYENQPTANIEVDLDTEEQSCEEEI